MSKPHPILDNLYKLFRENEMKKSLLMVLFACILIGHPMG